MNMGLNFKQILKHDFFTKLHNFAANLFLQPEYMFFNFLSC